MTPIPAGWKPRLSCPFCGSTCLFTVPDEHGSGGQWVPPIHVGCNDCQAEQVADTEDEAVERWNRRSSPASVAPGDAPYLQALADKVVIMNATGDPDLFLAAVKDLLAAVRTFSPAPAAGDALALLDHPLLRDVLGYIEDAGPADVWGAAQSWMALRDAALTAQVPQQGEA